MNVVVAPILPQKLDRWNALAAELTGARSADWEDYLRRYGLTRHVAFLVPTPTGSLAVLFVEGPGASMLMQRFATSDHPFEAIPPTPQRGPATRHGPLRAPIVPSAAPATGWHARTGPRSW